MFHVFWAVVGLVTPEMLPAEDLVIVDSCSHTVLCNTDAGENSFLNESPLKKQTSLQRQLSRKVKFSNNRQKLKRKIQ